MYTASVPQLSKMLQNLDVWLGKAEEHAASRGYDPNVLLQARLSPDMLPLLKHVQIACDGSKFVASRLSGKDAPRHEDTEQSVPELRARIQDTVRYLATISEEDFRGAAERRVRFGYLPPDKEMLGHVYLNQYAMPNTYFHLTIAYALLRHNGVPLGKMDYLGQIPLVDVAQQ